MCREKMEQSPREQQANDWLNLRLIPMGESQTLTLSIILCYGGRQEPSFIQQQMKKRCRQLGESKKHRMREERKE